MLFFVNTQGVPSKASIIRISPENTPEEQTPRKILAADTTTDINKPASRIMATQTVRSLPALNETIIAEQSARPVKIGLTPVCPYGLGACWAGAFEALQQIGDIAVVRPLPDHEDSVAWVYLKDDIIPDLDSWRRVLQSKVGGAYDLRGIELTLSGIVTKNEDQLVLSSNTTRPEITLSPFKAASVLERDNKKRALKPVTDHELSAYASLLAAADGQKVKVTGRLHKREEGFDLDVREWDREVE